MPLWLGEEIIFFKDIKPHICNDAVRMPKYTQKNEGEWKTADR
jgi:hypothetical protein